MGDVVGPPGPHPQPVSYGLVQGPGDGGRDAAAGHADCAIEAEEGDFVPYHQGFADDMGGDQRLAGGARLLLRHRNGKTRTGEAAAAAKS